MEGQLPKLSVAIRVYNQEDIVLKALDSVIRQSYIGPVELILAVDLSSDNSLSVVQDYCKTLSDNFTYQIIAHSERQGGTRNLISALRACNGEYIAILDADDYWIDQEKSVKQISILDSDPGIGLVYGDFIIESGSIEEGHMEVKRPAPSNNVFTQLLYGNFLGTHVTMFRRSLLDYVDFTPLEEKKWSQDDYYLWLEFANHCKFHHLNDFVAVYTITRDTNAANIPYDACAYDIATTEVKEYYLKKYPDNTDLTIPDIWDMHFRMQFRAARLVKDHKYALEAINSISSLGKDKQSILFKLCKCRFFWRLYLAYFNKRHLNVGLDRYFL